MKKHTVPAALAAAFAAALVVASPAFAAHVTRHHNPVAQTSQNAQVSDDGGSASAPTFGDLREIEHPGCYDSRIQVPTVGGGLQWEPDMECNYGI